ncbi:MAG: MFS transporter [Nocardioides sp.]|nr:MFS transporter [Nocardioides sp.]
MKGRLMVVGFLLSDLFSLAGNAIIAIALPLLVLQVTQDPIAAGTVAVSAAVPQLLAALVGGYVVDRWDRRKVSITADVISALSVASIPLVDLTFGLSTGWFIVLGIAGSFGDVPGTTARQALAPRVAKLSGLSIDRIAALRGANTGLVTAIAPAVAGFLMTQLPGATVMWITAATSFTAALVTTSLPQALGAREHSSGPLPAVTWRTSLHGFRVVKTKPLIRSIMSVTAASGVILGSIQGLLLPIHFESVGRPDQLGLTLSAMAVGMLAGASASVFLHTRFSRRKRFIAGMVLLSGGLGSLALLLPAWWPLVAAGCAGIGSGMVNAVLQSALMDTIAEDERGRVMSAQNMLILSCNPVGLAATTLALQVGGVTSASMVMAICAAVFGVGSLASRALRLLNGSADMDH